MEKRIFKLRVAEELVNLLQRYGYEYDTRCDIVARIVARAASVNELDNSALAYYQRLADESKTLFESSKAEFSELVVKPEVEARFGAETQFRWKIPNYADLTCEIEIG